MNKKTLKKKRKEKNVSRVEWERLRGKKTWRRMDWTGGKKDRKM